MKLPISIALCFLASNALAKWGCVPALDQPDSICVGYEEDAGQPTRTCASDRPCKTLGYPCPSDVVDGGPRGAACS
ncbi:hypothetical protein NX059_008182 [Plenodomus lindquistii]|nr:hypothetical protein NX059_008182 [Plenodomus lindquistii]